jgi:hypothetical protein
VRPKATRPRQNIRLQTRNLSFLTNQPGWVTLSIFPVMPMVVMVVIPI